LICDVAISQPAKGFLNQFSWSNWHQGAWWFFFTASGPDIVGLTKLGAKVLVHKKKNMELRRTIVCAIGLLVSLAPGMNVAGQAKPPFELKTRNVVLIVTDGLRWQDDFNGPDISLMNQEHGGVENIEVLRHDFLAGRDAEPDGGDHGGLLGEGLPRLRAAGRCATARCRGPYRLEAQPSVKG